MIRCVECLRRSKAKPSTGPSFPYRVGSRAGPGIWLYRLARVVYGLLMQPPGPGKIAGGCVETPAAPLALPKVWSGLGAPTGQYFGSMRKRKHDEASAVSACAV